MEKTEIKDYKAKNSILQTLYQCITEYDRNLQNKKIMFVFKEKNKISYEEMYFPKSSFYHLTGVEVYNNKKEINAYEFYERMMNKEINETDIILKDGTTYLKSQVLPELVMIDKTVKMIGDFNNSGLVLQTEKLIGNVRACLGFAYSKENNCYVPNSALNKDIRKLTNNPKSVVGVFKKDITDNLYKDLVYLNKKTDVSSILKNKNISKNIDIEKLHSENLNINKKIFDYLYNKNKQKEEAAKEKEIDIPSSANSFYELHKEQVCSFYNLIYGIKFNFTKKIFDEDVKENRLYLIENNQNTQFLVLDNPFYESSAKEEEIYRVCMNLENGKIYIDDEADKILDLQDLNQESKDNEDGEEE